METSLAQVLFSEGASIQRGVRLWKRRWKKELLRAVIPPQAWADRPGGRENLQLATPLHAYYPFLFRDPFPEISPVTLRRLSAAERHYIEHLLHADRCLDAPGPTEPLPLFLSHLQHLEGLKRLYGLFPPGHAFWSTFDHCRAETWRAVREERLFHTHRIAPFPLGRFRRLASGKAALTKPFSLALCHLSGRGDLLERLSTSLDRHHVGLALLDDLEDWREDLLGGSYTFLLTRLLQRTGLVEEVRRGREISLERLGRLLHETGLAEEQLALAARAFREAGEAARVVSLPLWEAFNEGFRLRSEAARSDLVEIRRRGAVRLARPNPGPGAWEGGIREGIRFLARAQEEGGGFRLYRASHDYMTSPEALGPSRLVTAGILHGLQALQGTDPAVEPLLGRASAWLEVAAAIDPHPDLPAPLEKASLPLGLSAPALLRVDRTLGSSRPRVPDRLFLSVLLQAASEQGLALPATTARIIEEIEYGRFARWGLDPGHGPPRPSWGRLPHRPLLPLLWTCRALGEELPRSHLHGWLLAPVRVRGWREPPGRTALVLLCLLLTGYEGPELVPAAERLLGCREPDGSWPPNAFYRKGKAFYGSREATTCWAMEALCRCRERVTAKTRGTPLRSARTPAPRPRLLLQQGFSPAPSLVHRAESVLRRLHGRLPLQGCGKLFLGTWPAMPPHFLLPALPELPVAVNLRPGASHPTLSRALRPLETEMAMALVLAVRYRNRGPIRDPLEGIYVAGLAMQASLGLRPGVAPWTAAGMTPMAWSWCREHAGLLEEILLPARTVAPDGVAGLTTLCREAAGSSPGEGIPPSNAELCLGFLFCRALETQEPGRDPEERLHRPAETLRNDLARHRSLMDLTASSWEKRA